MFDEIFLLILAGGIAFMFSWAFRTLPEEDWQVVACLPGRKGPDGIWTGVNLTYYGFFNALAYVVAVAIFLTMVGSLGMALRSALSVVLPVLLICMWSARFIARLVEKTPHAFSVGAASFVGIVVTPWIIGLTNMTLGKWWAFQVPMIETLAAMVIAYAFGEGIGRLACISFGCCYGKPLAECSPVIRKIFRRWHFVFWGKTKKIAYAQQLEGHAVVPIQALTAILYSGTGLLTFYLFLKGFAAASLIIALYITQGWRFVSEFLRADYRGNSRISVYQIMALIAGGYTLIVVMLNGQPVPVAPNLPAGLISLWNPGLIIFLGILWIVVFAYMGRSSVTCSSIDIQTMERR